MYNKVDNDTVSQRCPPTFTDDQCLPTVTKPGVIYCRRCDIGFEPAVFTVHPSPPPKKNDRGWVNLFCMGIL